MYSWGAGGVWGTGAGWGTASATGVASPISVRRMSGEMSTEIGISPIIGKMNPGSGANQMGEHLKIVLRTR